MPCSKTIVFPKSASVLESFESTLLVFFNLQGNQTTSKPRFPHLEPSPQFPLKHHPKRKLATLKGWMMVDDLKSHL